MRDLDGLRRIVVWTQCLDFEIRHDSRVLLMITK
jgi:hypothetical protein